MNEMYYVIGKPVRISKNTYLRSIINSGEQRDYIPKKEIMAAFDTFNLDDSQNVQVFKTEGDAEKFARSQATGTTNTNDLKIPPIACVHYTGISQLEFSEQSPTIAFISDLKIIWGRATKEQWSPDKYDDVDLCIDSLDSTMETLNTMDKKADFLLAVFNYYNNDKTSDHKKKIGRLKKIIINIADKYRSVKIIDGYAEFTEMIEKGEGKLSTIIDFHRNRKSEKDTATRSSVENVINPSSSGCRLW